MYSMQPLYSTLSYYPFYPWKIVAMHLVTEVRTLRLVQAHIGLTSGLLTHICISSSLQHLTALANQHICKEPFVSWT